MLSQFFGRVLWFSFSFNLSSVNLFHRSLFTISANFGLISSSELYSAAIEPKMSQSCKAASKLSSAALSMTSVAVVP